jgi:hypothetical protein
LRAKLNMTTKSGVPLTTEDDNVVRPNFSPERKFLSCDTCANRTFTLEVVQVAEPVDNNITTVLRCAFCGAQVTHIRDP